MRRASSRRRVCRVPGAVGTVRAGKTAIAERCSASRAGSAALDQRHDARAASGEADGVHYHFRGQAEFDRMVAAGELLEWARVLGRHATARRARRSRRRCATARTWCSTSTGRAIASCGRRCPDDVVGVFILPPTLAVLERRLRDRSGDDAAEIARRMQLARDEISHWPEFDHVVVNDDLDQAVVAVRCVLHAARLATVRLTGLKDAVDRL